MKRSKKCQCGKIFEYEVGRGKDRKYCSDKCADNALKKKRDQKKHLLPQCSTIGCDKPANRRGAGLCEACYMRLRRKGTTDYSSPPPYRTTQSAGYIKLREPYHPLADSHGLVYEHRFVFHKHNGDGPFKCHWCGIDVEWGTMDIDHVDEDKENNSIDNLVPSCPECNRKRGMWKMIEKLRAKGKQITYNGVTKTAGLWAKDIGISRSAFTWRMEHWDIEDVMTKPKANSGPSPRCIS